MFLAVGGVFFAFLAAEIAVRLILPAAPKPRITEPAGNLPFVETANGLYVYRPRASFAHVYDMASDRRGYLRPDGRIEYRINNLGFRGDDISIERRPGVRRILCLGDSFTFGEGVREHDSWPQQLDRLLGENTEVINAGVQGYDFDSEARFLRRHGRQLKPDVVIIGFFMNDAMPFGETVAHHLLRTETPADVSRAGRISALWGMLEQRRSAAGQTGRYLDDLRKSFSGDGWRSSKARMAKLRTMADRDRFQLVAVIFPLLYRLEEYPLEREHAEVRKAFADAGIEVVDLLDAYRGQDAEDLWVHPVDPHPNERAHAIAAERVARWLDATRGR